MQFLEFIIVNKIRKSKIKDFSIAKKLREEKKSNEYFETMLSNLNLEELIALRLEMAYRNTGTVLYNLPIWKSLDYIIRDAVLKYGISINESKIQTAKFLGINLKDFKILYKKYNLESFFEEGEKNEC